MSSSPEICLVQIVRNEARCIERSLSSVRPHVDRLVVVDTGSTDSTAELARQAGAEVYHFEWCNDFSAARNWALSIANASWALVLDADEWIDTEASPGAIRSFVESGPRVGILPIHDRLDTKKPSDQSVSWLPRVFPGDVRYEGRIHEQPVHQLPVAPLALTIYHDGYTPELRAEKLGRNMSLLRAASLERPEDPYIHYQIGRLFESEKLWNLAIDSYTKALSLGADGYTYSQDLDVRHLTSLARAGRFKESLATADRLRKKWPASVDVHFAMGDLLMEIAASDAKNAHSRWLPLAESTWLTCLRLGDHQQRGFTYVIGRGSHDAAHNLALVYAAMGNQPLAERYADFSVRLRRTTPRYRSPTALKQAVNGHQPITAYAA